VLGIKYFFIIPTLWGFSAVCLAESQIKWPVLWCLLSGSMWSDGRISIGQCDLVESWDNLSLSQKKNLNYRYQMGCECRVIIPFHPLHAYSFFSHSSFCLRSVSAAPPTPPQTIFLFWNKDFEFLNTSLQWQSLSLAPTIIPTLVCNTGKTSLSTKYWLNIRQTSYSSLIRSTPVTRSRVALQEKMSACGQTGCWITV